MNDDISEQLPDSAVRDDEILRVLNELENLRLVRSNRAGSDVVLELSHPYISDEIESWLDEQELKVKLVRRLVKHQTQAWLNFGQLIGVETWEIIQQQRGGLGRLPMPSLELLVRSAIARRSDVGYWGSASSAIKRRLQGEFLDALEHGTPADADIAAHGLVGLSSTELVNGLVRMTERLLSEAPSRYIDLDGSIKTCFRTVLSKDDGDGWRPGPSTLLRDFLTEQQRAHLDATRRPIC